MLGAVAFQRQLIGLDRNGVGLDGILSSGVIGKGGARSLDDCAFRTNYLLQRLALLSLCLADACCGKTALEDRQRCAETDRRRGAAAWKAGEICPEILRIISACLSRESWQTAGTGDTHVVTTGDCLAARRDQVGVVGERDSHRLVLAGRQGRKRRRRR